MLQNAGATATVVGDGAAALAEYQKRGERHRNSESKKLSSPPLLLPARARLLMHHRHAASAAPGTWMLVILDLSMPGVRGAARGAFRSADPPPTTDGQQQEPSLLASSSSHRGGGTVDLTASHQGQRRQPPSVTSFSSPSASVSMIPPSSSRVAPRKNKNLSLPSALADGRSRGRPPNSRV